MAVRGLGHRVEPCAGSMPLLGLPAHWQRGGTMMSGGDCIASLGTRYPNPKTLNLPSPNPSYSSQLITDPQVVRHHGPQPTSLHIQEHEIRCRRLNPFNFVPIFW